MGARADLADALGSELPATTLIVPSLRSLGELDPAVTAVVNLFRTQISPTPNVGRYAIEFELWVCTPLKDPDAAEDDLDDSLDAVIEALDSIPNILWAPAVRATHDAGLHGWKITVTTAGSKE